MSCLGWGGGAGQGENEAESVREQEPTNGLLMGGRERGEREARKIGKI